MPRNMFILNNAMWYKGCIPDVTQKYVNMLEIKYSKKDKVSLNLRLECILTDILKNIQFWILSLLTDVHSTLTDLVLCYKVHLELI